MNKKTSSSELSSLAASKLRDPNSSAIQKTLAGSVMSQAHPARQTGKEMEAKASSVLRSEKYNSETKALAASVVAQSNKRR